MIELLKARSVMTEDQPDHFTHALLDIRESAIQIYNEYLPRLQRQLETNAGDVEDTTGDIREVCRHIDYHLKDAKLSTGV